LRLDLHTSELVSVVESPWAVVAIATLVGYAVGRLVIAIVKPAFARAARQSATEWDDALVDTLATPISALLAIQGIRISLPWLPIDARAIDVATSAIAIVTVLVALWIAFRSVDLVVALASRRSWAVERPASRSLLSIAGRLAKGTVVVLAAIILLAHLGVSVASLIAGLGIGGLALALAAQKTVENLFGTVSIGVDQPLREGDFVRVGDVLGTVEAIGLRSTRVRTLDRTLVTIPNGQLADLQVESFSARDRIRLACTLGLVYATTADQLRRVLDGLESVLRSHPSIWPDNVLVKLQGFGASSLDIEVMAWFQTSDWPTFQAIRQDILLGFMRVVEAAGSAFAFPTRTLHLEPVHPTHDDNSARHRPTLEERRGPPA
jgi:MscS family membrane protein